MNLCLGFHPKCVFKFIVLQGLFRIAAGASKLKKLKAALDCSTSQLEEFYSDPHAVAGKSCFVVCISYMSFTLNEC